MKISILGTGIDMTSKEAAISVAVLVVAGFYVVHKAKKAAKKVAEAVNPVNSENIVNQGFHGFWNAVTDGKGTLGTDIYDFLHGVG